ncbi:MAG TPA: hypothetical protein PLI59_09750, partial [Candidatus Obscuribacter sp.]|nr:hypothetical protein [Candidatus Obscuribacter sp.]
LWSSVKNHKKFLEQEGLLESRRLERIQAELSEIVADIARRNLKESLKSSSEVQEVLDGIIKRQVDPHTAARKLIGSMFDQVSTSK